VWTSGYTQNSLQTPKSSLFPSLAHRSGNGTPLAPRKSRKAGTFPEMKPRILIVDDDSQITQQLYWTLCDEYDVVTANDMQAAFRRATFYKPDISILDLQMPPDKESPASGLRLLEYIKGHLPQSRVLIMSSNTEMDVRKACFAAGADGFFAKPFELEEMLASICKLTPVHRLELFAHIL
jgi:CheY-like chemotaxis protein